jgi:hypothetical protein
MLGALNTPFGFCANPLTTPARWVRGVFVESPPGKEFLSQSREGAKGWNYSGPDIFRRFQQGRYGQYTHQPDPLSSLRLGVFARDLRKRFSLAKGLCAISPVERFFYPQIASPIGRQGSRTG